VLVRKISTQASFLKAGFTALSEYTMISEDRVPAYATGIDAYQQMKHKNMIKEVSYPEEAEAKIEVWRYQPEILSSLETVDKLSLFLSMKNETDERVQSALNELMEGIKW
jgi:predicted HNH restriction endonuclease